MSEDQTKIGKAILDKSLRLPGETASQFIDRVGIDLSKLPSVNGYVKK